MRLSVRYASSVGANFYDVIIAGGGMVGATMACSLANKPQFKDKRILVVDAAKQIGPQKEAYSNRVSAISPASKKLFQDMNVWETIESSRKLGYVRQMQVWESCSQARIQYDEPEQGHPLANIIENDNMIRAVLNKLAELDNATVKYESTVRATLPQDNATLVHLDLTDKDKSQSESLQCSLLIGADGAKSGVRQTANIPFVTTNYKQRALVATIKFDTAENSVNDVAYQRFTPKGPIALLPLDSKTSSLVWTTTPEDAIRLAKLDAAEFLDELSFELWTNDKEQSVTNQLLHLVSYLPGLRPTSGQLPPKIVGVVENTRASFPLGVGHSVYYCAPRMALIGDAAHWVHPLAGQGVNLGFGDVAKLTQLLCSAVDMGADIGSLQHLKDYESARQLNNVPVMGVIDGLNRLYSNDWTPLVLARSLGLHVVNSSPFLKSLITSRAST